jgi:hypothetical protein
MDKALTLVGGSFVAAAKLIDLTPDRFRNLVNGNPALKSKWGRKKKGPGIKLDFRIQPYTGDHIPLTLAKEYVQELLPHERAELLRWMQELEDRLVEEAVASTGCSRAAAIQRILTPPGPLAGQALRDWRVSIGCHPDGLHGGEGHGYQAESVADSTSAAPAKPR